VGWYKVGLELIASQEAAKVIGWIKQYGGKVFYDIKLNDTPTTVERAVRVFRGLSVDLINMHATAGVEAMRKAKEAAGKAMTVAAVTVLTSMDAQDLSSLGFDMHGRSDADAVGSVCWFGGLMKRVSRL
jgi:orotidine-5'-phosphate decarboxylase